MQFRKSVASVASTAAILSFTPCGGLGAQEARDSTAVVQTARAYHEYLAAGDTTGALRLLSPDVVIVESGNIEDLEHYRTGHLIADMRYAQSVTREPGEIRVVVRGDVAWAASTASITGERQGEPFNSTSAELMVLSRHDGGWRIRAIHWSSRRSP
jgi:ketosteroid isomerase-like protein